MAIGATLEHTGFDRSLVGHVVMSMAAHSHRDLICGAQGMRCRGGLGSDVPALTVAGICGSGAEEVRRAGSTGGRAVTVERDGASEAVATGVGVRAGTAGRARSRDRHDSRGVSDPRQPHFFPAGRREALAASLLPLTAPLVAGATQGDEPLLSPIILSTRRRPIRRDTPRMETWP
jgi:hypothetical protein